MGIIASISRYRHPEPCGTRIAEELILSGRNHEAFGFEYLGDFVYDLPRLLGPARRPQGTIAPPPYSTKEKRTKGAKLPPSTAFVNRLAAGSSALDRLMKAILYS
jgi:hypothetical protein